jgi:epoxyqueuosine reductase
VANQRMPIKRPDIRFIPISTDPAKIKFFGTLMPSLLLLKASPLRFMRFQVAQGFTPQVEVGDYIQNECDDAGRSGDVLVFVHRWNSLKFDPFTFARAKTFLKRVTTLIRRSGYTAEPFDPLSPELNLPKLAEKAGLGNLSPYGLLVHPEYGPRVILTGVRTTSPLEITPRYAEPGCNDCMACIRICPQKPLESGIINLRLCQSCAKCLEVCPTGRTTKKGI